MGSFEEGGYVVKVEKVSELFARDKENTELHRARLYEKMHYAKYGRFTLGGKEFEMRVCPWYGNLDLYICSLENAGESKYGIVTLVQDHNSISNYTICYSNHNHRKFDFCRGPVNVLGLGCAMGFRFNEKDLRKYCEDDCLSVKFFFGVLPDGSCNVPAKPAADKKPNQPEYSSSPPDFISKLLVDQFADIQFIVKEQTFSAHRAILAARSSVFQSELLALQDETCCNKLHISVQHMDALTFKYLLHFIYTDSLPSDFEANNRTYHLMFIAAHRFKIERLMSICEEKLTKAVTDTIIITLELNECDQELKLLKIVPKNCHMKPDITTTTASVRKALLGERAYGT